MGCVIKPLRIVRADQDRRIPVDALGLFISGRQRFDVNTLAGAVVVAGQVALLPVCINDVGIGWIRGRLVAIRAQGQVPVFVANANNIIRARWPAEAAVVLRTAKDVVKRFIVVNRHLVKLRYRHIRDKAPGLAKVQALVYAAVIAHQQVVFVAWMKRHRVMVNMLLVGVGPDKILAAVLRDVHVLVHLIDTIELVQARKDFLVVMRPRGTRNVIVLFLPGFATVL